MTTSFTQHFRLNLPDFNSSPWHVLLEDNFNKIDDVMYRLLAQQGIVTWANNTNYGPGTIAFDDTNDTFWFCTTTHTSAAVGTFAADRAAHPTYWTAVALGLAAKGEWTNDTSYQYYDLVYDTTLGIVALCTTPHISSSAPNDILDDAANWAFIINIANLLNASTVAFTPSGGIAANNVQDALEEVDGDLTDIFAELAILDGLVNDVTYGQLATAALATGANYMNDDASKLLNVNAVWDAAEPLALGNKNGSVTLDCGDANANFTMTLTGNVTIENPTSLKLGQNVSVLMTQDGTGGRTTSFGNQFFPLGGTAPAFKTTAGAVNFLSFQRMTSGIIVYTGGRLAP